MQRREGENICFEVMSVLSHAGCCPRPSNVYRAKFSSLTERDIKASFGRPQKPDENQSNAVKARQELDLKIGVSFTRLLTRQMLEGAKITFDLPTLEVISYGFYLISVYLETNPTELKYQGQFCD